MLLHHVGDSMEVLYEAITEGYIGADPATGATDPAPARSATCSERAARLLGACARGGRPETGSPSVTVS